MGDYPERYDRFFDQELSRQFIEFDALPTEEQITIHVLAVTERHPPFTGFGRRLAKRGSAVSAPILKRLESVSNDWDKLALIQVLSFMPQESRYDVGANRDVMDRLRSASATIRNDVAAQEAKEFVKELEEAHAVRP